MSVNAESRCVFRDRGRERRERYDGEGEKFVHPLVLIRCRRCTVQGITANFHQAETESIDFV